MKNKPIIAAVLLGTLLISGCGAAPVEPTAAPAAEKTPVSEAEAELLPEDAYMQALLACSDGDYGQAVELVTPGAENVFADAQMLLGICAYYGAGTVEDKTAAFDWLMKAAEQDNIVSQKWVGTMLHDGVGAEKDLEKAFEWYSRAAGLGSGEAMYYVGCCCYAGDGTEQSDALALEWMRKAADAGETRAMLWLGCGYYQGQAGLAVDLEKAYGLFAKAAYIGDPKAMCYAGRCCEIGSGTAENPALAIEYYTAAAELGNAQAQYYLGQCYLDGRGVEKDPDAAHKWTQKAADQGNADATAALPGM